MAQLALSTALNPRLTCAHLLNTPSETGNAESLTTEALGIDVPGRMGSN